MGADGRKTRRRDWAVPVSVREKRELGGVPGRIRTCDTQLRRLIVKVIITG